MGLRGLRRRLSASLLARGALLLVGVLLVGASAALVFEVLPRGMDPTDGQETTVTERARIWTPDRGWDQVLRTRSTSIQEGSEQLLHVEAVQAAHAPRGYRFALVVDETLEVAEKPGVRAGFPARGFFEDPLEVVHLAVPWQGDEAAVVGAYDTFHRMGTTERSELTVVEYHARHSQQAFLHEGTVWYRFASRTAFVEPASGAVVDYRDHEILWKRPAPQSRLGQMLHDLTTEREKAWEAIVEPTPAAEQALVEQAKLAREENLEEIVTKALPVLATGELMMWAAIARRPQAGIWRSG